MTSEAIRKRVVDATFDDEVLRAMEEVRRKTGVPVSSQLQLAFLVKRHARFEMTILREIARGVRRFETLRRRTGLSGRQLDGHLRRLREDWMIYVQMVPLRKKPRNPRVIGDARFVLSPRGRKRLDGDDVPTWRKPE